MKILAIEFSSTQRSVAVVIDGRVCGEATHVGERSVPAFDMIERALKDARIEREDIECIAIGIGPGSYTGIRVGISLAQGWQLARPIKLLGISSAECLAHDAQHAGIHGRVNVVIDAQRGEFYLGRFDVTNNACTEAEPLKLVSRQVIDSCIAAGEIVVGPGAEHFFKSARALFPSAATLGRLAGQRTNFVPGEKLEPIYLRETTFVKARGV